MALPVHFFIKAETARHAIPSVLHVAAVASQRVGTTVDEERDMVPSPRRPSGECRLPLEEEPRGTEGEGGARHHREVEVEVAAEVESALLICRDLPMGCADFTGIQAHAIRS